MKKLLWLLCLMLPVVAGDMPLNDVAAGAQSSLENPLNFNDMAALGLDSMASTGFYFAISAFNDIAKSPATLFILIQACGMIASGDYSVAMVQEQLSTMGDIVAKNVIYYSTQSLDQSFFPAEACTTSKKWSLVKQGAITALCGLLPFIIDNESCAAMLMAVTMRRLGLLMQTYTGFGMQKDVTIQAQPASSSWYKRYAIMLGSAVAATGLTSCFPGKACKKFWEYMQQGALADLVARAYK